MHFLGVFTTPKTFASGAAPRTGPFFKSPHLLSISGFFRTYFLQGVDQHMEPQRHACLSVCHTLWFYRNVQGIGLWCQIPQRIIIIIIIIIWLVKRQYVLKRLQWRWKDFSGASKFKKLHSSVVITLFLIINSYSVSTKKCHKMRHFDKNIQNFLRRGHLESTKIRHFNPKIFKKISAKGEPSLDPFPCASTPWKCSKKT